MATLPLSGSTNGTPIGLTNVRATLHTAVSGTTAVDQIYLWLVNTTTGALTVTVEFGFSAGADTEMIAKLISVPARSVGKIVVCDGQILQNGKVLAAYIVGATSGVNAIGYVVR